MGIHGHAKIELTDVNTGAKECYEEDNLVTNAMYHLLNDWNHLQLTKNCELTDCQVYSYKELNNINVSDITLHTFRPELLDFTRFALKGVKLFSTDITESRNHVLMNSTEFKSVIGYGSCENVNYSYYDQDDTKNGTYNTTESGALTNGYKFVWDFGTTKANGTIKTVCLTDSFGGLGAASPMINLSQPYRWIGYSISDTWYSTSDARVQYYRYPVEYSDDTLTCLCGIISSATYYDKLRLRTYQFECNSWSPTGGHIRKPKLLTTTDIAITSNRYLAIGTTPLVSGDYYYLLGRSTSSSNFDYLISLNKKTNAVTETNLATAISTRYGDTIGGIVRDTYLYYLTGWRSVYKISLLDNSVTNVGTLSLVESTQAVNITISQPVMFLQEGVIYTPYGVILDDDTLISTRYLVTADGSGYTDAIMYALGYGGNLFRDTNALIFPAMAYRYVSTSSGGNNNNQTPASFNANMQTGWLATINNLSTPVIKNSTKTMKITYTITWS